MARKRNQESLYLDIAAPLRSRSWKTKAALTASVGIPLSLAVFVDPAAANVGGNHLDATTEALGGFDFSPSTPIRDAEGFGVDLSPDFSSSFGQEQWPLLPMFGEERVEAELGVPRWQNPGRDSVSSPGQSWSISPRIASARSVPAVDSPAQGPEVEIDALVDGMVRTPEIPEANIGILSGPYSTRQGFGRSTTENEVPPLTPEEQDNVIALLDGLYEQSSTTENEVPPLTPEEQDNAIALLDELYEQAVENDELNTTNPNLPTGLPVVGVVSGVERGPVGSLNELGYIFSTRQSFTPEQSQLLSTIVRSLPESDSLTPDASITTENGVVKLTTSSGDQEWSYAAFQDGNNTILYETHDGSPAAHVTVITRHETQFGTVDKGSLREDGSFDLWRLSKGF